MANADYQDIARQIIEVVGKENIISATHCATRLRLTVKDKEGIDHKKMEKIPLVKGTFFNAGQYQVILGTGIVNKVYAEIGQMGLKALSKQEQDDAIKSRQKGMKRVMRVLGDIFVPIIPIIAATGLFLGIKGCVFNDNVLALFGANPAMIPGYIVTLVNVLTETAFAFLPAIICWSAYKVFGGMPVIGMVIGLMLVSPALPNAYSVADPGSGVKAVMAFGRIPVVGCQGSVLSAILTAYIGANLEKKLRKAMPNALDLIMTPFIVMLITFLVTILGIGPVMHVVEWKLVQAVEMLVGIPFGVGGFMIGATYPLFVITGLHHTYTMIETSLLANTGYNPVITLCAMYGFANVGTCLAFFVKSRQRNVRQTAVGAMLSQLFGISEPVLFGIQLRYNLKPLIIMLFSSGLGAAALSVLGIRSNSYGLAVLPSYLMYIYEWRQLFWYFIVSVLVAVFCFVLTSMFGIPKEILEAADEEPVKGGIAGESDVGEKTDVAGETGQGAALETGAVKEETLLAGGEFLIGSPLAGTAILMGEVADATFASEVLGKGMAVVPEEGKVVATCEAEVTALFDTGHAIGLKTKGGVELLIHVGINTVELQGKYYETHVSQGDKVKPGQLLVTFDIEKIREAGYDVTTLVIVANTGEFKRVEGVKTGHVKVREPLIKVEGQP